MEDAEFRDVDTEVFSLWWQKWELLGLSHDSQILFSSLKTRIY